MFCPTCGTRCADDAQLCPVCGTALAQPLPPPPRPGAPYDGAHDFDDTSRPVIPAPVAGPAHFESERAEPAPDWTVGDAPGGSPQEGWDDGAWEEGAWDGATETVPAISGPPPARRTPWLAPMLFVVALALIGVGLIVLVGALTGDDDDNSRDPDRTVPSTSTTLAASTSTTGAVSSTTPRTSAVITSVAPSSTFVPPTPITVPRTTVRRTTTTQQTTTTEETTTTGATTTTAAPSTVPTTTVAPTSTIGGDPAQVLADWVEGDHDAVEALVDSWVPQVSAKKEGTEDDGIVYTLSDIVAHHQGLREEYDAVLLWSGDYIFTNDDLWITIVPEGFEDPEGALDWCDDHDLDSDHCFARLITHDESIENTARFS